MAVFVLGLCATGLVAYDAWRFLSSPLAADPVELELTVERGDTVADIGRDLAQRGLLSRPLWWRLYARVTGVATKIRAGEFVLSAGMSPVEVLGSLQRNAPTRQYAFTILEGWSIWQLRAALAADEVLLHETQDVPEDQLMAFIGAEPGHPEGQFLPDTYHFPRGTTDKQFLLRAHKALQKTLDHHWQQRQENLPLKSAYEALTLASIIEKETGIASEREMIAGVMVSRLRKKMRLQTDPTVIYGIGPDFNGDITRKDLKADTPYNTYRIPALPPTPIAMSGREAIAAAVNPASTSALFFVADGTGGHVFSETVEQHNAAVRKYILKRQ